MNSQQFSPPDVIEFWRPEGKSPFMRVTSSFVPRRGDTISIQGTTYKVRFISFALDYSERVFERQMRLNVTVEPVPLIKNKTASTKVPT